MSMHGFGMEVHGELHGTTGTVAEITLYSVVGTHGTAGTAGISSSQRLVVTSLCVTCDAAGDCAVFFDGDNDNQLDAGETIVRFPVTQNGGLERNFVSSHIRGRVGPWGAKPHVFWPTGTVDVDLVGYIEAGQRSA